jgi:hypothetical protein
MIKISHEVPLCLLEKNKEWSDYQYCLPHLLDKYEKYRDFFMECKKEQISITMDNSLHELGTPYSYDRLHYWLNELSPNEFFIPDYWENKDKSIISAREWSKFQREYPNIKFIAVVQAKNLHEAIECVQTYKDLGYKKIAFSYGASYYLDISPYSDNPYSHPDVKKSFGRIYLIDKLNSMGLLDDNDDVHLLGTYIPSEFKAYVKYKFIKSLDTSNPIMSAIDGDRYPLFAKPKSRIDEVMEINIENIDEDILEYNIKEFRQYIS